MTTVNPAFALTEERLAALLVSVSATLVVIFAVILALGILMIAATWCIFRKAGTGGWKALIPVYCDYTFYKIAWKKKYFFIMCALTVGSVVLQQVGLFYLREYALILDFVSSVMTLIALIIEIISIVKLAKAFRKGGGFAVGLIFLPFIFLPILGFGSARYRRKKSRNKKPDLPEQNV